MATATAGKPLAAKKRSDGTPPVSVKLPADVVDMARIASAYRNVPMGDLLGDLLRPVLIKMVQEETAIWAKSKKSGDA